MYQLRATSCQVLASLQSALVKPTGLAPSSRSLWAQCSSLSMDTGRLSLEESGEIGRVQSYGQVIELADYLLANHTYVMYIYI